MMVPDAELSVLDVRLKARAAPFRCRDRSSRVLRVFLVFASLRFTSAPAGADPEEPLPPFEFVESRDCPALADRFRSTDGWTGGDGLTSLPLGPDRILWMFADSWIGKIENGRRVGPRMVNNAAGWMSLRDAAEPTRYFWNRGADGPASLIPSGEEGVWIWPGDGALVDGRLYLLAKRVRPRSEGLPGFRFHWFADEILRIDNPLDEPTAWRIERRPMPAGPEGFRTGLACLVDGGFLYVGTGFPKTERRPGFDRPVGLSRIPLPKLAVLDMTAWEYRVRGADGDAWSPKIERLAPMFRDGGAEVSVSRIRGIPGFVATYTTFGMGRLVRMRHAERPEGPWSRPVNVHECPASLPGVFFYGAKAHPELSTRDGQVILTYSRNIGTLEGDILHPEIYFPQAAEVQLRLRR